MGRRTWSGIVVASGLVVFAACGGGDDMGGGETTTPPPANAPAMPPATADTGDTMGAADLPEGVTPEMVAAGQQIFTSAGLCFTCHGQDATGQANLGPNLTDDEWLHTSGRVYDEIVQIITTGVQEPTQFPAPMPAKGGSTITDEQVRQVAAYVVSLGN